MKSGGIRGIRPLMINTSATGVDGAVELIADYLKMKGYVE